MDLFKVNIFRYASHQSQVCTVLATAMLQFSIILLLCMKGSYFTMKTLLFFTLYLVGCVHGLRSCSNKEKPLSEFCAKNQSYSKVQNPDFPKPTTVYIEVIIRDILNVDVENHLVEFVAYSNLHWTDSRIDIRSIKSYAGRQTARPTSEELNKLWTTDVHYANAIQVTRRFKYYTATKDPETRLVKMKLNMLYRVQVTCEMDFSNFPFDSHTCCWWFRNYYENNKTEIIKISQIHNEKDSKLATKDEPILKQTKRLPFDIEISPGDNGRIKSVGGEEKSIAFVQFKFTRTNEGQETLITGYYIPTGLFATLSLISFLIKPEIVPGRMGMLVILFLIYTNIYATLDGPSSRGFSYVDVWYVGMFLPIIMAITEYAIILAIMKYRTENEYNTIVFGKITLKRLIAHIDVVSMCLSLMFMIVFVSLYYLNIPSF